MPKVEVSQKVYDMLTAIKLTENISRNVTADMLLKRYLVYQGQHGLLNCEVINLVVGVGQYTPNALAMHQQYTGDAQGMHFEPIPVPNSNVSRDKGNILSPPPPKKEKKKSTKEKKKSSVTIDDAQSVIDKYNEVYGRDVCPDPDSLKSFHVRLKKCFNEHRKLGFDPDRFLDICFALPAKVKSSWPANYKQGPQNIYTWKDGRWLQRKEMVEEEATTSRRTEY